MVQKLVAGRRGSALVGALAFAAVLCASALGIVKVLSMGSDMDAGLTARIRAHWANEGAAQVALRYCAMNPSAGSGEILVTPPLALNGFERTSVDLQSITDTLSSGIERRPWAWHMVVTTAIGARQRLRTICENVRAVTFSYFTAFDGRGFDARYAWVDEIIYGNYHTNGFVLLHDGLAGKRFVGGRMSSGGRISPSQAYDMPYPALERDYRRGIALVSPASGSYSVSTAAPSYLWFAERFPDYSATGAIPLGRLRALTATPPPGPLVTITRNGFGAPEAGLTLENSTVRLWKFNGMSGSWSPVQTVAIPRNGSTPSNVVVSEIPLYVQGTLDGRLTIITTGSAPVYLTGSIRYLDMDIDCADGRCSDDALGVLAAGPLYIADSDAIRADGQLVIYGSYMCPSASLQVEELAGWPVSNLIPFTVFGSLLTDSTGHLSTAQDQGVVETICGDPRFLVNRSLPPGLPQAMERDAAIPGGEVAPIVRGRWSEEVVYGN